MEKLKVPEFSQGVCADGAAILRDGVPLSIEEILALLRQGHRDKQCAMDYGCIIHDMVVSNQSAWIEWQHGGGADAGMRWIENGLWGPGRIPDEDEPFSKNANHWFSANKHDPFPVCACGNPSSQLWMGKGACSDECMAILRGGVCE